jgi:predicted nucleic acid-binding protein
LNYAFATHIPEHREASVALLDKARAGRVHGYISDVVLGEVARAPAQKRAELENLISASNLGILDTTERAVHLAQKYIDEGIFPGRYVNDALHVAVAVVNNLDCVISWNFRHIVRPTTRRRVNAANRLLGYPEIEIASPEEVL